MAIGIATPGFMLLDTSLHPVGFSEEMLRILACPRKPERVKQPSLFVFDKVRSSLVNQQSGNDLDFVKLYKSGNRRYTCRSFRLECSENGKPRYWIGILLERYSCGVTAVTELSKHFDLTSRERETVEFLLLGLTSNEIAERMQISPNAVRAFLKLVIGIWQGDNHHRPCVPAFIWVANGGDNSRGLHAVQAIRGPVASLPSPSMSGQRNAAGVPSSTKTD